MHYEPKTLTDGNHKPTKQLLETRDELKAFTPTIKKPKPGISQRSKRRDCNATKMASQPRQSPRH